MSIKVNSFTLKQSLPTIPTINCLRLNFALRSYAIFVSVICAGVLITTIAAAATLSGISYDTKSFDVDTATSASSNTVQGLFLKSDGTKLYTIGYVNYNEIYQFSLSTPWDISTATYDSISYDIGEEARTRSIFFTEDGASLYVLGDDEDTVFQYSLSTPWDVSTMSYTSKSYTYSEDGVGRSLQFKNDGTKMFIHGTDNDTVYQYTLSTPWDVSTASYDSVSFSIAGITFVGMQMNRNGNVLYAIDATNTDLREYTLSTPWDLSTISNTGVTYDYNAVSGANTISATLGDNDSKLYMGNLSHIYQFTISDATPPTIFTLFPADNATDVPTGTGLTILFSEEVQGGTGSILLKKTSDDTLVESIAASGGLVTGSGTATIEINPTDDFENATSYYIEIEPNAFRDSVGLFYAGISDTTTWNFTTVAAESSSSSGGGWASHKRIIERMREEMPKYYDKSSPTLSSVGIFNPQEQILSSGAVLEVEKIEIEAENHSLLQLGTEERGRLANINRRLHAMLHEQDHHLPAVLITTGTDEQPVFESVQHERVCTRVERRFPENQTMIDRINKRLQKRFGWICAADINS